MEPKATHIFLKDPVLLKRLREEAAKRDRSIRSIVTAALNEYLARLDEGRAA